MSDGGMFGPPAAHREPWTTAELARFTVAYRMGGLPAAREACPGRSDPTLMTRASDLGIPSPLNYRGPAWSDEDIGRLTMAWARGGLKAACAEFPDRTCYALTKAATRHRISGWCWKKITWDKDDIAILRAWYPVEGANGVHRRLPWRTLDAIHAKAKKSNIRAILAVIRRN